MLLFADGENVMTFSFGFLIQVINGKVTRRLIYFAVDLSDFPLKCLDYGIDN